MRRFLIILFYILIIFFVLEIFSRFLFYSIDQITNWTEKSNLFIKDSLLGWRGNPDRTVTVKNIEGKFFVQNDHKGFRNIIYKKYKNRKKILAYGDSFLWGFNLSNDRLITSLLSNELKCEVKNFGIVGYGTDQEYLLFKETVEDSSIVVFFFYLNDLRDILYDNLKTLYMSKPRFIIEKDSLLLTNYPVAKNEEIKTNEVLTAKEDSQYNIRYKISNNIKSFLYRFASIKIFFAFVQYTRFGKFLYEKNLMELPDFMQPEWDIPNSDDMELALKIYEKIMIKVKKECAERGCELIVFIIPSEFTYDKKLIQKLNSLERLYGYKNRYEEIMDRVKMILDENNIDNIYPLEEFKEENLRKHLIKRFDKHFSEHGSEFVKEILKKKLIKDYNFEG